MIFAVVPQHEIVTNWVSVVNSALLLFGGTWFALCQRRAEATAKARELARQEHARDLAAGLAISQQQTAADTADIKSCISEVHSRLDAVIQQRDILLNHYLKLADDSIVARCPFAGRIKPSEMSEQPGDDGPDSDLGAPA